MKTLIINFIRSFGNSKMKNRKFMTKFSLMRRYLRIKIGASCKVLKSKMMRYLGCMITRKRTAISIIYRFRRRMGISIPNRQFKFIKRTKDFQNHSEHMNSAQKITLLLVNYNKTNVMNIALIFGEHQENS